MSNYISPEQFEQYGARLCENLFTPSGDLIRSEDFGDWARLYTNGVIHAKFRSDRGQFSIEIAPEGFDDFLDLNVVHGSAQGVPFSEIQALDLGQSMKLFLALASELSTMPTQETMRVFEIAKAYAKQGTKEMFGI